MQARGRENGMGISGARGDEKIGKRTKENKNQRDSGWVGG